MSIQLWWRSCLISRQMTNGLNRVCVSRGAGTSSQDTIVIPERIHRSPTDILKALSSTVGKDTSGPHYKFSDDPYLTPHSNMTKRSYALSKEAGRKAARWIRQENTHLFTHTPDDPRVESFHPRDTYTLEEEVVEEEGKKKSKGRKKREEEKRKRMAEVNCDTLTDLIVQGRVTDAVTVYKLCQNKGLDISDEVRQKLLELLCYNNCQENIEQEWIEERWFQQSSSATRKTWKDNGLAEEVFESLTHTGAPAYCALIRGMAQYYQVDRAWNVYQECKEKGIVLDTGTHNALLRVSCFLRDAPDLRWQLIKELLSAMAESGTSPDLGTLNATLEALTQVAGWRQTREISLQVMAEFHQLGIQPSLASYYYLLAIHCKERGPRSSILLDILDRIESSSFTLEHPIDVLFMVTAMEVARNHLRSLEAARRVDAFRQRGENYLLIGDSYKESVYYRHYFAISCSSLPFDEFMSDVYNELVPHTYIPEPGIMQEVMQTAKVSSSLHHLPQLWSDMVLFDLSSRERLLEVMISTLTQHQPEQADQQLTERIVNIAKDIWKRVQGQDPSRRNKVTWTGQMLGGVLEVLVRCGGYSTALEVLEEATYKPQTILGFLPPESVAELLSTAIERQDADTAVGVILYCQEAGHMETGNMAIRLGSSLPLSPHHRAKIASSLGPDIPLIHTPTTDTPAPQGEQ